MSEMTFKTAVSVLWPWRYADCTEGIRSLSAICAQQLSETNRVARLTRFKQLLKRYSDHAVDFIWFTDEKVFTVEPPFNPQNDRVYAPVGTKKRHIDLSRLLRMSVMVSVAVSQVGMTELIFVDPAVKVNGQYYCDVLLSQQMLPAIKPVAERSLFTKQYVAYGEICHFLCSMISQGKAVALDR